MNPKSVKKHICEELAHGKPIQLILKPPVPPKKVNGKIVRDEEGEIVPDPDWVQPDLPDWNNVVQWLKEDEVFRSEYDHALKYGAVYLADEMLVLKDKLLLDPKSAPAYKCAMDMIKVSAMWRDPKYSERTIQEIKNSIPQDADVVAARIKQLRQELGLEDGGVVDVIAHEVKPKHSPKQIAHYEKMREAKLRKNRGNPNDNADDA